ncbi:unnamed protein product, partial [Meganyctiphanes norvegica]
RCGSESIPKTQASAEIMRKSASTDNFVPPVTDVAGVEHLRSSSNVATVNSSNAGLWAELLKSRHNSSEFMKSRHNSGASVDILKSRHNSGGDVLKSRHNSGSGSVMGLFSDVSSLLESGQTTEDGCEGDISDSDDCCDWLQDFELVRPFLPEFWLILSVTDKYVETFFHCRSESEMSLFRGIQQEVVRSVRSLVKLVNQILLLENLNNHHTCNDLLEPQTSEDIWKRSDEKGRNLDDTLDPDENRGYLEAALKFKPGAFSCKSVWQTHFELHPKVKLSCGKLGSKGMQALRTVLTPFSVSNRKNMFVFKDLNGNVFYIKLAEHQITSASPQVDSRRDDTGLSRSSSVVSLGKRGSREDDPFNFQAELRPRVSSFGEKDVIMEGVPSTPAQRKCNSHYILLTVHGVVEPGPDIKEQLIQMLRTRLDEAVVDAICAILWNNPQHKLTPEDVHFIQPPYQPQQTLIRFTVNAYVLPYLQAIGYYLRQNMLSCGFINPNYSDQRPEHHFQDFSATDQDLSSENNMFLFVRPAKAGAKGIACIALSMVDGSGASVQPMGCPRPALNAYQEIFSKDDFECLTQVQEYQPSQSKKPGPVAMLQFKVWESGRVDLDEVRRYLLDSTHHALWDVNMEYRMLSAPLTSALTGPGNFNTPASEPSTPCRGKKFARSTESKGSLHCNRASSPLTLMQTDAVPQIAPSHSPLKLRHSMDLGMERTMLLGEETSDYEQGGDTGSSCSLHPVYFGLMLDWLEYAIILGERGEHRRDQGDSITGIKGQGGDHAVRKHTAFINNKHSLHVFLHELQKWVSQHWNETSTKIFEEVHAKDKHQKEYIPVDSNKLGQILKSQVKGDHGHSDLILVSRNHSQWLTSLYEESFNEYYPMLRDMSKSSQRYLPLIAEPRSGSRRHHYSSGGGGITDGSHSNTGVNTPVHPTAQTPIPGSASTTATIPIAVPPPQPLTPSSISSMAGTIWPWDVSDTVFLPRQKLLLVTLTKQELTLYTYNWTKDQSDSLHMAVNRLAQWSSARTKLLSSLVLQKCGIFYNQPFTRKKQKKDR